MLQTKPQTRRAQAQVGTYGLASEGAAAGCLLRAGLKRDATESTARLLFPTPS